MTRSAIEWTETTWNPCTGCDKISPGCKNCYAERLTKRLKAMGQSKYQTGFSVTCHPEELKSPSTWKKPRLVFVNSMSDLFHPNIPSEFIHSVFLVMSHNPKHTFQILTKRSERLAELNDHLCWRENIWMGVSVENSDYANRIDHLRQTNAAVKFLSIEPLLGPMPNLNLAGIDWVIVGGESGPKSRPMNPDWVRSIRDQCIANKVPFFFKQWGGVHKKKAGRILDGRIWDEMPILNRKITVDVL